MIKKKRLSNIEGDIESYISGEQEEETLAAVRAVFSLGNRLVEAPDESTCFDQVTN